MIIIYKILGYNFARVDHLSNTKDGSICLYYKYLLPLKLVDTLYLQECVNIFDGKTRDKTCNFISPYRSPAKQNMNLKIWLRFLNSTWNTLQTKVHFRLMMNWFCDWWWIGFVVVYSSLISSLDLCQSSSPSQISDTPRTGSEYVQNLSSDFVEWSCAVVITTTLRGQITTIAILGDFHASMQGWHQNNITILEGSGININTSQFSLIQMKQEPRHILNNLVSCIDIIATSQPELIMYFGIHPSPHPIVTMKWVFQNSVSNFLSLLLQTISLVLSANNWWYS